jgi:hypothetical protein
VTRNHSRITGALRIIVSVWLLASAVRVFADPQQAVSDSGQSMATLLPQAGLSFAVGAFLLTGFMSRVMGLILVAMAIWESAPVLGVVGVYLAIRGGGAWAMDIYVQKMQDRVRMRELSSPESTSPRSPV